MAVVFELHRRAVQFAGALGVNQARRRYQDVRYRGVLQQRFEWAKAEDFIQDLFNHPVFFHQAQGCLLFLYQLRYCRANFGADALARHRRENLQVDPVQKFSVQCEL